MKHVAMLMPLFMRLYDCRTSTKDYRPIFDDICTGLELGGITLLLAPPSVANTRTDPCQCFDGGTPYRPLAELWPLLYGRQSRLTARHWFKTLFVPGGLCRGALVVDHDGRYDHLSSGVQWLAQQLLEWQQHYWYLSRLQACSRWLETWVNLSVRPQLVCDRQGNIMLANQGARLLLESRQGMAWDNAGRLAFIPGGPEGELLPFAELGRGRADCAQLMIAIADSVQVVHLVRLPAGGDWLVVIKDPELPPEPDIGSLARLFALSRVEQEHLALLAKGCCTKEIAQYRHISPETARTTLKSIFRKTGRRRQTDLLLLIQALS